MISVHIPLCVIPQGIASGLQTLRYHLCVDFEFDCCDYICGRDTGLIRIHESGEEKCISDEVFGEIIILQLTRFLQVIYVSPCSV